MAATAHELPPQTLILEDSSTPLQPQPSQPPSQAFQSQTLEAAKDIAFGSLAGILGKFVEYPFDTIKVRLQSQSSHATPSAQPLNGPFDAFAAAWRSPDGPMKSLYRGISAPLLGAAIETSSLFFSYRVAQDLLIASSPTLRAQQTPGSKPILPFSALLACGAASGAFTSLLLTPIELIKCKMQVPLPPSALASSLGYSTTRPPGPQQLIRIIYQAHGLAGFWHGQLGTLIRETGGSAAWFGSYEGVKIAFQDMAALSMKNTHNNTDIVARDIELKIWQQMCAGAAAGVMYNFVFYPADTVKSRMQTEEAGVGNAARKTFLSTGKELWARQGLKGFYRGCGITVFRAAPSSAIIFSIYEGLRKWFG